MKKLLNFIYEKYFIQIISVTLLLLGLISIIFGIGIPAALIVAVYGIGYFVHSIVNL